MDNRKKSSGISRRKFIRTLGMVTGAAAVYPLQAHARVFFNRQPDIAVGLLSPRSRISPHLGENLETGMKFRFAEAGAERIRLLVADTGFDPYQAIVKARELLTGKKVDILAGFLNPLCYPALQEVLQKSRTPFINMEAGSNVSPPAVKHPLIYHNTLGYWQANQALGRWSSVRMGRRACIATLFYESGYDSSYAFRQGFEGGGGRVINSDVTHIQSLKPDLGPLMEGIRRARPDFVYAQYSGQEAVDFVTAYAAAGLAGQIPLVASPFMVSEALLPAMGKGAIGIKSCMSWSAALDSPENASFCSGFSRFAGREADPFALLGYETGRMICEAASAGGRNCAGSLRGVRFTGPRGPFSINPLTLASDAQLYITEVRAGQEGLRNEITEKLPKISELKKPKDRSWNGAKSGWVNAYLCI